MFSDKEKPGHALGWLSPEQTNRYAEIYSHHVDSWTIFQPTMTS